MGILAHFWMKNYSIFLKLDPELSKTAAWEEAKAEFLKLVAKAVKEHKVIITAEQKTPKAVDISIDEKHWEEIKQNFINWPIVEVIDAEYIGKE